MRPPITYTEIEKDRQRLRNKCNVLNRRLIRIRNERNKYKKMYENLLTVFMETLPTDEDTDFVK